MTDQTNGLDATGGGEPKEAEAADELEAEGAPPTDAAVGFEPDAPVEPDLGVEPEAPDEEPDLAGLVVELQSELDDCNDRSLRLAAEFQNFRRRSEAQRIDSWTHAQAELVAVFLDVLDDLQRVSGLDPEDEAVSVQSIVEGVDLVERKFLRALQDAGVEVIDPLAEPFDPERMEAMMRVATEDAELDDTVQSVFQKGYSLRGRLVRAARVSVFKSE